jgi:hypothetical protein
MRDRKIDRPHVPGPLHPAAPGGRPGRGDRVDGEFWTTDKQFQIIDRCLQVFGGFGCMLEHPIARMFTSARVQRIYGGTNEIMKEIIARAL